MRDQTCTYCGKAGHRAHRCPMRSHAWPWGLDDLAAAAVMVVIIALGVAYA